MSESRTAADAAVDSRPTGRDEVVGATTRAAIGLFSKSNPSQVSVREIAAAAGVSHALVHRYMGSKDDIFFAALRQAREDASGVWTGEHGTSGTFGPDHPAGRYLHMVVRGTLDGMTISPDDLRLPHAHRMIEMLESTQPENAAAGKGFDARLLFSVSMSILAAMDTSEEFFLVQSGLEDADRASVRSELNRLIVRILSMVDPDATIA